MTINIWQSFWPRFYLPKIIPLYKQQQNVGEYKETASPPLFPTPLSKLLL
ncbi:predicted protein [Botrytis cinerea T4]|uniref:Uncharacterized protein n=1 Tax=Botryotinia fuckeliana (strain T4) TaxID=999810 RepID=G2YTM6_BOTF4|nr:predicted protein [Botrytis cinerea T4]